MSVRRVFHLLLILSLSISIVFMAGCSPDEKAEDEQDKQDKTDLNEYEVEVQADPEDAGEIEGEGTYEEREEVTVKAIPDDNYVFTYWRDNDGIESFNRSHQFPAEDKKLVAHFITQEEDKIRSRIEEELSNNWEMIKQHWSILIENKYVDELQIGDFERELVIEREDSPSRKRVPLNLNRSPDNEKVTFLWQGDHDIHGHYLYTVSGYYDTRKDDVNFTSFIRGEVGAPLWSPSGKHFAYIGSRGPGSPTNAIVIEGVEGEGFIIGDSRHKGLSGDYKELGDFNEIKPYFTELEWSENGEELFFTKGPGPATPPEIREELREEGKRLYFDIKEKEIKEESSQ